MSEEPTGLHPLPLASRFENLHLSRLHLKALPTTLVLLPTAAHGLSKVTSLTRHLLLFLRLPATGCFSKMYLERVETLRQHTWAQHLHLCLHLCSSGAELILAKSNQTVRYDVTSCPSKVLLVNGRRSTFPLQTL